MMGMRHILVLLVVGSSGTYACYEEFNGMYWTSNQCKDASAAMNPMDAGQDVQDCVALCTMQNNCTSLNYWVDDGGKNCALLNCNATKPEGENPSGSLALKKNDTGYEEYEYGEYWSSDQCERVLDLIAMEEGQSSSHCMNACSKLSNCTSFNCWRETEADVKWCELLNCNATKPEGNKEDREGYYFTRTAKKLGYEEFNEMHWREDQCYAPLAVMNPMNTGEDVQDCVVLCAIERQCTGLNYWVDDGGNNCVLLDCRDTKPSIGSGSLAFKKLGTGLEPVCKPTNICKKRGGTCMANYCPCDGFIVARGCKGGKNCKCCAPTRPIRCRTNRRCRNSGGKCKPITELEACIGMNGTMINHKCQGKRCGCCIPN